RSPADRRQVPQPLNLGLGCASAAGIARRPACNWPGMRETVRLGRTTIFCRGLPSPAAREVTMRASASSTVFEEFPWPDAPALPEFHGLGAEQAGQGVLSVPALFEKRAEPAGTAPAEIAFGPFRVLPTQYLLLEDDRPVSLGSRALQILIVLLGRAGELV